MKKLKPAAFALGVSLITINQSFGQTNLQFTGINVTDEGAIQLHWASQSNHVYQIQCADSLTPDTNTGTITWNKLYDDYPSQGTNTFIGDFGNYLTMPLILHPKKMPMRFYRIMDEGLDDLTNDEPTISIISPTNGFIASGSLTITVAPQTDQTGGITTKLYVDGQEMWPSDDGSNYVINTCEWGNGTHILYATVECYSIPSGPIDIPLTLVGHAVSAFVPVVFSNLVTRISFSEPFFNPDAGQTQQVSAVFAANCDWTLRIKDINSNVVRTVTGSGTNLIFNWDGNDDSEAILPAGVYHYFISAQTNGLAPQDLKGGSSFAAAARNNITELWATPVNGGDAVPLKIYPQGFDTNNLIIFPASDSEMESALFSSGDSITTDLLFTPDFSGPSPQDTPPTPQRPPPAPMDRVAGTFSVAYQTYFGNGGNFYQPKLPANSGTGFIAMQDGHGTANPPKFWPLKNADSEAINFVTQMQRGGWTMDLFKADDQLQISDLRGSGSALNQANLVYLALHCVYGVSQDFMAGGCLQMYYPIASGASSQYLRMSDMNWGGAGTNGLKWIVIDACHSLYHVNWNSMQGQMIKPYNSSLHMILGCDTDDAVEPLLTQYFAQYIFMGKTNGVPMTIQAAWFQAANDAYKQGTANGTMYTVNPMNFAVAYDTACLNDTLKTNFVPQGNWNYISQKVYPPQ